MSHTSVLRVAELHDALKHALAEQSTAHAQQQAILKQLADVRAKEQAALHSAQNILSSLKCMRMTLSALQATQIGVTVGKLRKSDAVAVASISAELIKSWKAIAECGGRGMEGDGVVDRSGKSPTKAAASSSSSSAAACSDEERTVRSVARLQDRYAKLEEQKNSRKSEPREPFPGDLLAFLPRCCADVRPSYQCSPRPHSPCTRRQGGGGAPEEDKEVIDESRGESEPRRRTVGRPNRIPWPKPPCTCVSLVPLAQTSPRDRRRNGKAPFAPNATFVLFNIKLI